MLDKIMDWTRSCAGVKKVCIFFAVFAVTLTAMGGTLNIGTGGDAPAADSPNSEIAPAIIQNNPIGQTASPDNRVYATIPEQTGLGTKSDKTGEIADQDASRETLAEKFDSRTAPAVENNPDVITLEWTKNEDMREISASGGPADPGGFVYIDSIPMNYELQEFTYRKCVERGLEYELVLAIMWRESRFKTDAVNLNSDGTRDNGIMQINDVNRGWLYRDYGIDDLMDPYQNIDAGTVMLSLFNGKYGTHGAMMAYQYGESGMSRRLDDGQTTSEAIEVAYRQRDYYRELV